MAETGKPSRDWLRFQQNLKNTSFGVRFGKKLFLNPYSISGRDATNALKLLGLEIPPGLQVGVDLAQIFASGSTLVTAVDAYQNVKSAENLQALSDSSTATLKIFTSIADKNGWIDQDTASVLSVGLSAIRIVASAGMDVGAWLSLGMELGIQSEQAKAKAQMIAAKGAVDMYKGMISKQAENLTKSQMRLQKGEIGLFGFLTEAASGGNILFTNVIKGNETLQRIFPGLNFVPEFDGYVYSEGESSTWYGDTKTANFRIDYKTIGQMDEAFARWYMWDKVIAPFTKNYLEVNSFYETRDKASLMGASILACIAGVNTFTEDTKFVQEFERQMLTPKDLGDAKIFSQYVPENRDSGISFLKKTKYTKEQINALEDQGLILEMVKDQQVKDRLKSAYTFQAFPETVKTDAKIDWRQIQNFVACLDYISLVKHDPSMKGKQFSPLNEYAFLPSLEKWEEKMNEAYGVSLMRKVNKNSMANVAYFLGTSPEKVQRVNEVQTDKPAIFISKG